MMRLIGDMHWLLLILSIMAALLLTAVGLMMRAAGKEAENLDITDGIGWFDVFTGEAAKKMEQNAKAESELKGGGTFMLMLALGAVAFAVYQGIQIWGDKPCKDRCAVTDTKVTGEYKPQRDWYR